jgi:ABC-type sugar transport system permease subunit
MLRYIAKRLIGLIPVFFGITLISFFVIHLAPGKPTDIQTSLNPKVSYEARMKLEKLYGLDKPIHIQYLNWLKRIVVFDFGRSYVDDRPVSEKIAACIPITLLINISSMALILGIGIPLGILSAVRRGSFLDKVTTVITFIGFSVPEFWLALLLMSLFSINLGLAAHIRDKISRFRILFCLWKDIRYRAPPDTAGIDRSVRVTRRNIALHEDVDDRRDTPGLYKDRTSKRLERIAGDIQACAEERDTSGHNYTSGCRSPD